VRIDADAAVTGVKMRATTGATGVVEKTIGSMNKWDSRTLTFKATCPVTGADEPTELAAVPTIFFTTHKDGKPSTHSTDTAPEITCLPKQKTS
jgi:hypothetical protein